MKCDVLPKLSNRKRSWRIFNELNMALVMRFSIVYLAVVLHIFAGIRLSDCRADISRSAQGLRAVTPEAAALPFITATNTVFGELIEAAAVDRSGSIFATAFTGPTCTLGQAAGGNGILQELFFNESSCVSELNGLRFLPIAKSSQLSNDDFTATALAADVKGHRVVKLWRDAAGIVTSSLFCEDSTMVEPNDVAIATRAGRVYTSGQNYTPDTRVGDGDLWVCEDRGFQSVGPVKARRLGVFGRTNGIEVSPDEKTLYLSEAFNQDNVVVSNKVWRFTIDPVTGDVGARTLFVDFEQLDGSQAYDVDGMRTDVDGNLFITRHGGGEVLKFCPEGNVLLRIKLTGIQAPTNLELGGPDGTSLFVVGACIAEGGVPSKGCVNVWHGNSATGRAFSELNAYS